MHMSRCGWSGRGVGALVLLALAGFVLLGPNPAVAQDASTETTVAPAVDDAQAALLGAGFEAYTNTCAGCHQAGGVGIEGTFPPLADNPVVMDTAYLTETIRNGKQGELVVNGVTYNGVMPAFASLPDDQVEAIVAYVQAGFELPAGSGETGTTLPVVTGSLPDLSGMAMAAAFALAIAVGLFILGPRIVAAENRLTMPWLDAWLRVAIIVIFFIVALAFVPSMIIQTETVARLPRAAQDVIGVGLWGGGFAVGLWALWYSHREGRI